MITYKWSIEKLKVTGDEKIVTHVYWRCDAKDEELFSASSGISELILGDTFIAYDQLTEEKVLDWCFEPKTIEQIDTENNVTTIVKNLKTDTENKLVDLIEYQSIQQTLEPALPWAV
jgi:hypothetical protein